MQSLTHTLWHSLGDFNDSKSLIENLLKIQKKNIQDFQTVRFSDFLDPFLFTDMHKAVDIITKNIQEKKRILIFGDYDADGMTGTAQIFLTLKALGAQVSYRLPCRADGYGLSKKFIEEAHEKNISVFITTDCGVSNIEEITLAKKLGMQVIITDHHSVHDNLPPADAILHPLVPEEKFPDKDLTGAGVAWFFCLALLQKKFGKKNAQSISTELLEIALIGTIADCGSLRGENRKIVLLGLAQLAHTKNKGLQELMKISGSDPQKITAETIAFFLAPRLNASGRLAHPVTSLELLLGDKSKAAVLEDLNTRRQEMVEGFLEDASQMVEDQKDNAAIILASPQWPAGIIGLISGRLAEKFCRPVIAFEQAADKMVGSCRGPIDFHIAKTLKAIEKKYPKIFFGCGGHAQAAGLAIHPQYYLAFCKEFLTHVHEKRGLTPPLPHIEYFGKISRPITIPELHDLQRAQPFGIGNPQPLFLFSNLQVITCKAVGATKTHLSLFLSSPDGQKFSAIFFREAGLLEKIFEGSIVDILAVPEINEWQGKEKISLKVKDMRESIVE